MAPHTILALLLVGGVQSETLQSCYSNIPFTEECKATFACLKTSESLCLSGGMDMGDNSLTCGGTPVVVNGQCAPAAPATPPAAPPAAPPPATPPATPPAATPPAGGAGAQPDPIVCTSCVTYEMSRSPECLAACPAFANCTSDGFTTDIDTACNIKCTNTLHPMGENVVVNGFCPSAHMELIKDVAEKSAKGMLGLFIFLGICGCCCLIACIAGLVYMLSGKKKRSRKQQDEEEEEEECE